MNKKTVTGDGEGMGQATAQPTEEKGMPGTLVWCGPTVRNIAKQYTVFQNGIPASLDALVISHPEAKGLLIPMEEFAKVRQHLDVPGTAESLLYQSIKGKI